MTSSSWRLGNSHPSVCGACVAGKEARSILQRIPSYQISNKQPPVKRNMPRHLFPHGRKRARVHAGVRGGSFREKGAGTMAVARPEPLVDWFIPIDGDGVHLGTR